MPRLKNRVNFVLDDVSAAKLERLADRMHTNPGTLARSLLATAIDETDPDSRHMTEMLDTIPTAFERAEQGRGEAGQGAGTPLEQL
jgi:hypothetical protein